MNKMEELLAKRAELDVQIEAERIATRAAVVDRVKKDIKDYAITVTELRSVLKTRKRKAATDAASADGEKKTRGRVKKTDAAA